MFFLKQLPSTEMVARYTQDQPGVSPEGVLERLTSLREASLLLRDLERYFDGYGLSQLRFLILIVIDREGEDASLGHTAIVERLDVSKPGITRAIKKLADDGHVVIGPDPSDRRAKSVALTSKGRRLLRDLLPGYFAVLTGPRAVRSELE